MPLTVESVAQGVRHVSSPSMVFDDDPAQASEVVAALAAEGFPAFPAGRTEDALKVLARERPGVLIVSDGGSEGIGGVCARAAELGIPVLVVMGETTDPHTAAERLGEADDWVSRRNLVSELPVRVARLHKRTAREASTADHPHRGKSASELPADSQFFALVVHDLRTPLNVIGLSLRMIGQSIPKGDPELEGDLRAVEENFRQIERMLTKMSDFFRLFEHEGPVQSTPFSPRRFVEEVLYKRDTKSGAKVGPVAVEIDPSCPAEVALDPGKASLALQYALANATTAAKGEPIRLRLSGGHERWVVEVVIDQPAPSTVRSVELTPRDFERLCGVAAERRGMDLAIAAKVSEMFGGSARLEVESKQRTTVVLDWPARLETA